MRPAKRRIVPITVYGLDDGLKSTEYSGVYIQRAGLPDARRQAVVRHHTRRGRRIDPALNRVNPHPAAGHHRGVSSPTTGLRRARPVEVAAGTRAFQIRYTALSFLAPDRASASRISSKDSMPAGLTPAPSASSFYNGVPPGRYRFRVRAANNDGVWNVAGATLDIRVLPYFYQTLWFRASLGRCWSCSRSACTACAFAASRGSSRVVMKERNRMAREIHDTLAQGLAAIGLHLAAIQHEPSDASRERHVEKARGLVETTLAEAHRSIWDLYPRHLESDDLIAGLTAMARDIGEHANADMGAMLRVESQPAAGTSVIVSVPLLPGRHAGITARALAAAHWVGHGVVGFRHAASRRIALVRAAARRRRSRSART